MDLCLDRASKLELQHAVRLRGGTITDNKEALWQKLLDRTEGNPFDGTDITGPNPVNAFILIGIEALRGRWSMASYVADRRQVEISANGTNLGNFTYAKMRAQGAHVITVASGSFIGKVLPTTVEVLSVLTFLFGNLPLDQTEYLTNWLWWNLICSTYFNDLHRAFAHLLLISNTAAAARDNLLCPCCSKTPCFSTPNGLLGLPAWLDLIPGARERPDEVRFRAYRQVYAGFKYCKPLSPCWVLVIRLKYPDLPDSDRRIVGFIPTRLRDEIRRVEQDLEKDVHLP
jgi:hypothetical protein